MTTKILLCSQLKHDLLYDEVLRIPFVVQQRTQARSLVTTKPACLTPTTKTSFQTINRREDQPDNVSVHFLQHQISHLTSSGTTHSFSSVDPNTSQHHGKIRTRIGVRQYPTITNRSNSLTTTTAKHPPPRKNLANASHSRANLPLAKRAPTPSLPTHNPPILAADRIATRFSCSILPPAVTHKRMAAALPRQHELG